MDDNSSRSVKDERIEDIDPDRARSGTTRRSFLKNVGKKALYVTPVVMTLTAQEACAAASPSFVSCGPAGDPCVVDTDCCSNNCMMGMCTG